MAKDKEMEEKGKETSTLLSPGPLLVLLTYSQHLFTSLINAMQSFLDQNTNCLLREKKEGKGKERKQRIWAFRMYNMTLPSIIILPSLTHMTTICIDKNETIG